MEEIIQMLNITKRFGNVTANNQVNLAVRKGHIHALLGENGSGKSTLMKILFGIYKADEGEIFVKGTKVASPSPTRALQMGICMIHQHFMLAPQLTVVENVIAGDKNNGAFINFKKARQDVARLGSEFGLRIDPNEYIYNLSVGEQQRVEIVKALYRGAEIMILDEPTAVLTPEETRELLVTLRNFVRMGKTIIFITHKLEEVMEFSDVCTVLHSGISSPPLLTKETTKKDLARIMVGREVVFHVSRKKQEAGELVAELDQVDVVNRYGKTILDNICLQLHAGEILGIAGVDGNGQVELSEVITGMLELSGGTIRIQGEDISKESIADIIDRGVAFIPAERHGVGAIGTLSVKENMVLRQYKKPPFSRRKFLKKPAIEALSKKLIDNYDIKLSSIEQKANLLSGGNLQKVILAREMDRQPKLLICVYPTRGLDVGAVEYIQKQLLAARESGTAILLISNELEEIMTLSDRIAVLFEGRIMGLFDNDGSVGIEEVGLMLAGVADTDDDGCQI